MRDSLYHQRISTKARQPIINPYNSKSRQPREKESKEGIKVKKKKIIISFD